MRTTVVLLVAVAVAGPAAAAGVSITGESGRSVFQRGETLDVAVRLDAPAAGPIEFRLEERGRLTRIGAEQVPMPADGALDLTYRIDTSAFRPGDYRLVVSLADNQQAALPFTVVSDVRTTDFTIIHMGMPGWVMPGITIGAASERYHFNTMNANLADTWRRGGSLSLSPGERNAEDLLRHGVYFMKYPTVFGWGLAHRPIRGGASWWDPAVIEASAQLMQYHMQAVRRFPNCIGLNPIDEPGVDWINEHLAAAFEKQTGMKAPQKDDREDLGRYVAYQVFRNHTLARFHDRMKPYMLEVAPNAKLSCQTFAGILTRAGLYPGGNTFLDIQETHTYDHWPTSNNWIAFALNLRRANRAAFWNRPLWTFTGCYGIMPDQWTAAWSLGMSEKLDGHGYFLGAGELPESQPWAEYSLAEMVRINRICEKYGDFFLALEKPVEPLALWYSLAQCAAADPAEMYEQEVVGAFFALKRCHFPVTIVTDEDLRAGLLKEHKVLMLVGIDYVPDDLREAVERFAAGGGKLVADRTTSAFENVVRIDTDFRGFAENTIKLEKAWREKRYEESMRLRRDMFAEESIFRDLPKVKEALLPLVERPVWAGSHDTFLAVQNRGNARYVFVANEASVYRHPNVDERWITMQESVPATDTITMPFAKGRAVYDLWTGEQLNLDADGAVTLRLQPAGLRVLCVYPRPVAEPRLRVVHVREGWPGKLAITAEPPAGGTGVVPAELELVDAAGSTVQRRYVALNLDRPNSWEYDLAVNDSFGTWQVRLRNLLTGKTSVVRARVSRPQPNGKPEVVRRLPKAISFDDHAYAELIKRKPLYVVPGTGCEAVAADLARRLGAEVRTPDAIRAKDTYPDLLDPEKNKGVWMMPRWEPLSYTTGADLVLVGSPDNNILVKDINQSGMAPRVLHPSSLGKGEGMVQHIWSPFDTDKDAAVVAAYDDAGLKAAAERFLVVAGLKQDDAQPPVALQADLETEAGPEQELPPQPPVIEPLVVHRLGTRIRDLAAGGGIVAAGTMDSRLCVFDQSGTKLWEKTFDYRVLGVAVSPDGNWIAAAAFPHTYVFDRSGRQLFVSSVEVPSREDVEGLALNVGRPRLVKGTWHGDVTAYDANGNELWKFHIEPPPKGQQPQGPQPIGAVRSIAMLPDGTIAAAGMRSLALLDGQGKEIARRSIPRLQDACVAGPNILAASFKNKLYLLDPKGESIWEKDTPDFIMAADASTDGAVIAAALFGGDVMVYDGKGELKQHRRLDSESTLTGIAVVEGGRALWMSTWEGELIRWEIK